jgi:hypothetical protein
VAAAAGLALDTLHVVEAEGVVGDVDESAAARIVAGGFAADVRTAIVADLPESVTLVADRGTLVSDDLWGSRLESGRTFTVRTDAGDETVSAPVIDPFAAEADAVSLALAEGRQEIPEMPWAQTTATARLLAEWRAALDG